MSVAPPWGGSYFWDERRPDNVRHGLFRAIAEATEQQRSFSYVHEFWDAGFFLVPGVKCPSEKDGNDHGPLGAAIKNCASYLAMEIELCGPDRVLALGREAMKSVSTALKFKAPRQVQEYRRNLWWCSVAGRSVPVAGTFFAGNNRNNGFGSLVQDIDWLLNKEPRDI